MSLEKTLNRPVIFPITFQQNKLMMSCGSSLQLILCRVTIQMKSTEQYFPVVSLPAFNFWMKSSV